MATCVIMRFKTSMAFLSRSLESDVLATNVVDSDAPRSLI